MLNFLGGRDLWNMVLDIGSQYFICFIILFIYIKKYSTLIRTQTSIMYLRFYSFLIHKMYVHATLKVISTFLTQ